MTTPASTSKQKLLLQGRQCDHQEGLFKAFVNGLDPLRRELPTLNLREPQRDRVEFSFARTDYRLSIKFRRVSEGQYISLLVLEARGEDGQFGAVHEGAIKFDSSGTVTAMEGSQSVDTGLNMSQDAEAVFVYLMTGDRPAKGVRGGT